LLDFEKLESRHKFEVRQGIEIKDRTLFTVPAEPRTKTSDVMLVLIERSSQSDVSLRILTDRMGDRIFGMLLILISVFSAIPFVSSIAGLLITFLGIQMVIGRKIAWLPSLILDHELHGKSVVLALKTFEPKIRTLERYIRPRIPCSEAFIFDRVNGLFIAILGIIIAIPLPFTNIIPAIVVGVMGLGLIERDGLVQICAVLLSISAIVSLYFLI
jgi:hypothetical protein